MPVPVFGYVDPPRHPGIIESLDVIQESRQRGYPSGSANQPAMQSY